jgi:hypothetical protein
VLLKGWQTKAAETARRFCGERRFIEIISGLIPGLFLEKFLHIPLFSAFSHLSGDNTPS